MAKKDAIEVEGEVVTPLPNAMFKVRLENDQIQAKLGPIYQQVMQRRGANVMVEVSNTLATSASIAIPSAATPRALKTCFVPGRRKGPSRRA